ncbi:MAG: hypothetical protein KKH44_01330 [Bacteroidetes bacterium]|nr:hypothetical protein [Bacteroidota bacterium]
MTKWTFKEVKFLENNGCCRYTGIPLKLPIVHKTWIGGTASLDRIDSNKKYVVNNIQWIHKDLNDMKWEFSHCYFLLMCNLVLKYREL